MYIDTIQLKCTVKFINLEKNQSNLNNFGAHLVNFLQLFSASGPVQRTFTSVRFFFTQTMKPFVPHTAAAAAMRGALICLCRLNVAACTAYLSRADASGCRCHGDRAHRVMPTHKRAANPGHARTLVPGAAQTCHRTK